MRKATKLKIDNRNKPPNGPNKPEQRYIGRFEITGKVSPTTYQILMNNSRNENIYNSKLLRKYYKPVLKLIFFKRKKREQNARVHRTQTI
jgi:hypothetical protein